jgi:transcriptional regulator with GAF, ATPase, and Fis domain
MSMARRQLREGLIISDHYHVEGLLGIGEIGDVYACRDTRNEKSKIVIKTLCSLEVSPGEQSSLSREFSLLQRLRHPNLVRLLDFGVLESSGEMFWIEERVEGKDVYAGTEGMDIAKIMSLMIDLTKALWYLHSRGIVHSSLKPSNAILSAVEAGRLVLLDFGLKRKPLDARQQNGFGSLSYTAPEILLGGCADRRSDLYALGVLMYQLLTRRLPFEDEDADFLVQKHLQGSVDMRPVERLRCGPEVAPLLQRLLEKDPKKRLSSEAEVLSLLGKLVGREGAEIESGGLGYQFPATRFVGREKEMLFLQERARRVMEGRRGRTVFVTGEAGLGKTRCMEELRSWALLEGWRIFEGACGACSETAYEPYRQILGKTESTGGEALFRFDTPLRAAESDAFDSYSEFATGQFRDLITRELVRRLTVQPTMMFLHDFHQADEATCSVLDYLSSDIQAHPVFMCVDLRSGEETKEALGRLMELAVRQDRAEILMLEPLEKEHVEQLVAEMAGDYELKEILGNWIFRSVGGNPFFLEEMLKHLVEQGLLNRDAGKWKFIGKDLNELEVPAGVGMVLRRRLSQLSPSARELVNWLALFQRGVSRVSLNSAMTNSADGIASALQELEQRQIIRMDIQEDETVDFSHSLIAEVIRNDLPKSLRQKMHRKIAEIIECESGMEAHLHELAMHYIEAKSQGTSVRYALASAARYRAEFAHENALHCFEHVFKNRNILTCEERCHAAIEASDTMFALGQAKKAIHLLTTEMRQGKTIETELRSRMFMQLALSYQHLGDFRMQEICCKAGLKLFQNQPETENNLTKAMLWAELAFGAVVQSKPRKGLMCLKKALQACPNQNATALSGRIQSLAASLHRVACNLHEALAASERAAEILSQSGESYLACSAYSTLGFVLMGLGRFTDALEKHKKAVALSDKSRSVVLKSQALGNLTECLCRRGLLQEALNTAKQGIKSVLESNNPVLNQAFNIILAEIRLAAGDYRGACQIIDDFDRNGWRVPALFIAGHAHYIAASLNYFLGNFPGVLKHIEQIGKHQTSEAPFYEYELAEALKARILFERGSIPKAIRRLFTLDRAVTKKHWPYQMCIIKLHIGEILLKERKLVGAEKYARNALRLANAMQSIPLMCHSHLLLGLIYSPLRRSADAPVEFHNIDEASIIAKFFADRSIKELQLCVQINETIWFSDTAWQAHAELCRIFGWMGDSEQCLAHAKKAYELFCKEEEHIPAEMLSAFYNAFERSHAKLELVRLIETVREMAPNNEISLAPIHDDENARILLRVSATINSIRELDPLLDAILDQLIPTIDMERALVFLKDGTTGKLLLAKGRNRYRESLSSMEAARFNIPKTVVSEGKAIISADMQKDPRANDKSADPKLSGKLFCAPLKASGRMLGVLYVDHSTPAASLSESAINLFAAFCNLTAVAIDNALAHSHPAKETKNEEDRAALQLCDEYAEIVGKSALMDTLRNRIHLVAASPLDVLITGESGTGKELVAQAICRTGRRRSKKFIPVDCGSLSDSLAEAELFGYRKGAFTGAAENRQGLLEAANGGILFLDEISNLPFRLQAKLLRVLQEREVRRIGETEPRKIDIQVIAATNKDLLQETRNGRFRRDLFYRLKAMEIRVPPLRERSEDIAPLSSHFLEKIVRQENGQSKILLPAALELLQKYFYPGNIRELKNIIAVSYYTTVGSNIGPDDLPPEVRREDVREADLESGAAAGRLYREILEGRGSFEDLVKGPFLQHQFGASRVRGVIQRALKDEAGNYRDALVRLRIPDRRYATTIQFLKRHKCYLDFRSFRRKRSSSGS